MVFCHAFDGRIPHRNVGFECCPKPAVQLDLAGKIKRKVHQAGPKLFA